AHGLGRDYVAVVGGPISDTDLGVLPDDFAERNLGARRRVEQGVTGISGGPLGARDEILPARFGAVCPAARLHQTRNKSLLLAFGNGMHDRPRTLHCVTRSRVVSTSRDSSVFAKTGASVRRFMKLMVVSAKRY